VTGRIGYGEGDGESMITAQTAKKLAFCFWLLGIIPGLAAIVLFLRFNPTDAFYSAATTLLYPTIAAFIVARRPENLLGWLLLATGIAGALVDLGSAYVQYATTVGSLPAQTWFGWVSAFLTWPSMLTMFTFILLLFPTGRLLSRRWRPLAWLAASLVTAVALYQAFAMEEFVADNDARFRNPMYIAPIGRVLQPLHSTTFIITTVVVLGSLLSLAVRLRRSRGVERQQLKWFVYVAAVSVVAFLISGIFATVDPVNQGGFIGSVFWITALFGIELGLPAVVGLAIVRYRLYEIDRIINRTLVYGVLTAILAGADLLLVFGFEHLLNPVASGSDLVVAGSTLIVAALIRPVRSRVQIVVDRRFYRHKYNAAQTLEAFSSRLRDQTDLGALAAELGSVVQETMQPAHVSLWLRDGKAQ
jgi:hypothetical protein